MNTIDSKQAAIFIAVFFVIALLINGTQGFSNTQRTTSFPVASQPSQQQTSPQQTLAAQQAEQAKQAAAETARIAAEEHAKFLAKYLNAGFTRQPGNRSVAIVISTDDGAPSSTIKAALARRFQSGSVQISTSLFTPAFVADGLFNDALASSTEVFRKLDLAKSVDALVLAQEDIQYAQNPALENIITSTIQLNVNVVSVSGQSDNLSWTFKANGPGFSKEVARKAAEDRLIKQIFTDTKMSLN